MGNRPFADGTASPFSFMRLWLAPPAPAPAAVAADAVGTGAAVASSWWTSTVQAVGGLLSTVTGALRSVVRSSSAKAQPTIIVVGLDNAGKTTLFRSLSFDPDRHRPIEPTFDPSAGGRASAEPPTVGFNMDKCRVEGHDIVLWDLGGQEKLRGLWELYFQCGVDAVVFVVDGTDEARLPIAEAELKKVRRYQSVTPSNAPDASSHRPVDAAGPSDAAVLVLVNKCDLALGRGATALARPPAAEAVQPQALEARPPDNASAAATSGIAAADRHRHFTLPDELRQQWHLDEYLRALDAERGRGQSTSADASGAGRPGDEAAVVPRRHPRLMVTACSAITGEGLADGMVWMLSKCA